MHSTAEPRAACDTAIYTGLEISARVLSYVFEHYAEKVSVSICSFTSEMTQQLKLNKIVID